jgi:uncharacterized protein with HEPN domain
MRSDPASTRRWLNHIRSQIELVRRFLEDRDYEAFRDDQLSFCAVTRCSEIIPETSRRLHAACRRVRGWFRPACDRSGSGRA